MLQGGDRIFANNAGLIDATAQTMKHIMVCTLIAAVLRVDAACAQLDGPGPWRHVPKITVVSAASDSRLRAVDEAVALRNKSLAEIGSGFRLGSLRHVAQPIPEEVTRRGTACAERGSAEQRRSVTRYSACPA